MKKTHGIVWWLFIGWWAYLIYFSFVWWWLTPLKKLIGKKKTSQSNTTVPKFAILSWGDSLQNLKNWQRNNARDQWINAKYSAKKLYHYSWIQNSARASLRAEPTNPHDKKAIALYLDDLHVGYVPREINELYYDHLLSLSNVTVNIHGGDAKYIDETGDLISDKSDPIVEVTVTL